MYRLFSLCIDACDGIMDKMSYPRGLIKYTTENAAQGKSQHILRPRIMVYAAILLVLCGALFVHISQRIALDLDVIRDRNTLYRETRDGLIENVYTLKILNMDSNPHRYILRAEGIDGLKLVTDQDEIMVEAGSVYQIVVRLQADEFNLEQRSVPVKLPPAGSRRQSFKNYRGSTLRRSRENMMAVTQSTPGNWKREPLVWMLIAIPLSAVIMGVVMITLAIQSYSGLVVDDYYKKGKQINRVLARDKFAYELGLAAGFKLKLTAA